ncbi:MAG: sigma-70 family polymerase sigma factor [Flaviaesturariibacter sp.]|nr:sigma-70 family polymerase sigma factor [Flaviaesturariibacter sp.]
MAEEKQMSDTELLALLRDGRTASRGIGYLYEACSAGLAHFVTKNGGSVADAQDVFQDVMVAFVHLVQAGRFRGEASIATFLFSMNRNLWFNELKKRGRATIRNEAYEKTQETEDRPDTALEIREASRQLDVVLGELGPACKKILTLFYYERRSMREILSTLDYENEQVVRNKKYKCLRKLESLIGSRPALWQQLKNLADGAR